MQIFGVGLDIYLILVLILILKLFFSDSFLREFDGLILYKFIL